MSSVRGQGVQVPMNGESSLWAAVLCNALQEAAGVIIDNQDRGRDGRDTIMRQARAWFSYGNPDFIEVCTLAGFDPAEIITVFKKAIDDPETLSGSVLTKRERSYRSPDNEHIRMDD